MLVSKLDPRMNESLAGISVPWPQASSFVQISCTVVSQGFAEMIEPTNPLEMVPTRAVMVVCAPPLVIDGAEVIVPDADV